MDEKNAMAKLRGVVQANVPPAHFSWNLNQRPFAEVAASTAHNIFNNTRAITTIPSAKQKTPNIFLRPEGTFRSQPILPRAA
jgi:hypothetical protein